MTDAPPPEPLGFICKTENTAKLQSLYEEYDALVFPSRFEGAGLVAIEAMCLNKPVFMTNTGISTELTRYVPQYVVDFESADIGIHIKDALDNQVSNCKMAKLYLEDYHSVDKYHKGWGQVLSMLERQEK